MQVVDNRLFTGGTDGSLRIWTLRGLRSAAARQPPSSETEASAAAAEQNQAEQ